MSKRSHFPSLIASLFCGRTRFRRRAPDDPMRVQGTGTDRRHPQQLQRARHREARRVSGPGQRRAGELRRAAGAAHDWFQGYGENFGRSDMYMFLRGGMYDVFKAGAYLNDIPHTFSSNAYAPYNGNGGNLLTTTFPLAALPTNPPGAGWNSFRLGYDRRDVGGYGEWQKNSPWYFRVDGNQVSFSGTQARFRGQRHEPGQRLHRPRVPAGIQDEQLGRRGRLPVEQGDAVAALGLQQVRELERDAAVDQPVLRPDGRRRRDDQQPARHDVPRAGQRVQQALDLRQLPRPAVAFGDLRPLHVVEDDERRDARHHGAQYQRHLRPHAAAGAELQRREHQPVARAGLDGDPAAGFDTRVYYYWTKLKNDSDLVEYGNAPTTPLASGLGCGYYTPASGIQPPPSATATARTTITPRTTSASTPGGSSRAASAWASAGTTPTSTSSASTTTSRTRTSCGPSTRTRCSTRCPPA